MNYAPRFVDTVPDAARLRPVLLTYYTEVLRLFAQVGGPPLEPAAFAEENLAKFARFLPPDGRLLIAEAQDGAIMGCGALRRISPDAGEMKHMYVDPAARGTGLGRALFQMRIAAAKDMGLRTLYADTVKGNDTMLGMYDRFGFQRVDRYDGNANDAAYAPYLVYLRCEIA